MKINGEHGVIIEHINSLKEEVIRFRKENTEEHKLTNERLSEGDKVISSNATWINAYKLGFIIIFSALAYLIFV